MRGVLHAEVFGFNFSADINPYQRSDDCVIAAGQITERPRRLSKTSADAPETERGTQVGGTHEHTSMCLSSSEMWLTRSIARNHVQSLVFFLKGVFDGRSLKGRAEGLRPISVRMSTPECVESVAQHPAVETFVRGDCYIYGTKTRGTKARFCQSFGTTGKNDV